TLQQNALNTNLRIRYTVSDIVTNIAERGRNQHQLLAAMQTPNNELGQFAAYQRNRARADLVQLVVAYNGVCGLGNHLDGSLHHFRYWGFSTVWHRCVDNFTHVHEFGHNYGAMHDRNTEQNRFFPWGFGFRDTAVVPGFSTVMTSCNGCSRINMFSSPLLAPNGRPMGTTMEDNRRVVDQTRHNAALVFPKDPGGPVDPEYPVDPGYPTGNYDHVFPSGLSTYRAGTRVLQPRNNLIYECRPFPNEG
ncbi:zinc-dependent metalloprotease family protein, partial [Candidatus Symbiopectobacterium sp. NZEC135]